MFLAPRTIKLELYYCVSINQRYFELEKSRSIGCYIINKNIVHIELYSPPGLGFIA